MQVGPEKSKTSLFTISGSSKFIAYTNIQIYVTGSIFIGIRFFFLNARNNVLSESITIEITKTANLKVNDPLITGSK